MTCSECARSGPDYLCRPDVSTRNCPCGIACTMTHSRCRFLPGAAGRTVQYCPARMADSARHHHIHPDKSACPVRVQAGDCPDCAKIPCHSRILQHPAHSTIAYRALVDCCCRHSSIGKRPHCMTKDRRRSQRSARVQQYGRTLGNPQFTPSYVHTDSRAIGTSFRAAARSPGSARPDCRSGAGLQ